MDRHRAESGLSPDKRLSSFEFAAVPSVSKAQVMALAEGHEWLDRGANVLLFGPTGVGKSHLVCGLGHALIEAGRRVLFTRCSGLTGVYVRGPLTVQGYFQSREFDNGLNDTDHVDEYGAGAEYRFGAFRVALSYGMADTELPAGGSVEHDAWSVGVGVNAEPRAFAVGILHHF